MIPNVYRPSALTWAGVIAIGVLAFLVIVFALGAFGAQPAGAAGRSEELMRERLRDQSGSTCLTEAIMDVFGVDRYFEEADSMANTDDWLPGTDKSIWVGDIHRAADKLGGELLGQAEGMAWLLVPSRGVPRR